MAWNGDGDMFSEERLLETLVRHRARGATELHDRILEDVRMFQQGRVPDDDLTLVLLKRTGAGVESAGRMAAGALAVAGGGSQA